MTYFVVLDISDRLEVSLIVHQLDVFLNGANLFRHFLIYFVQPFQLRCKVVALLRDLLYLYNLITFLSIHLLFLLLDLLQVFLSDGYQLIKHDRCLTLCEVLDLH